MSGFNASNLLSLAYCFSLSLASRGYLNCLGRRIVGKGYVTLYSISLVVNR